MTLPHITSAVAALVLGMTSVGAHAVIVNIDAKTSAGTALELTAGTYTLRWAGIAGGGLYDAWQYNNAASGNFRDAFSVTANGAKRTYDTFSTAPFSNYSTAAAALSAFQNASSYTVFDGSSYAAEPTAKSAPFTFTLIGTTDFVFTVPDNYFADNKGGVSLSITAAVPEPQTYALMFGGLGLMAFIAKRRKPAAS